MENDNEIMFSEPRKTFMEILKVQNREVPFANILAYFFKPKEAHGLKTLFLDALLETKFTNIVDKNSEVKIHEKLIFDLNSVRVLVEQKTDEQNRIDLLISTDTFVVCIEFKINHFLNNPLSNYKKYIEENFSTKKKYYFILTPFKKNATGKAVDYFVENNEFKQIILSHFINRVKEKIAENNTEFITSKEYDYFLDFVLVLVR